MSGESTAHAASSAALDGRLLRELRTIEAMIASYCRGLHGPGETLCIECGGLADYARRRLQRCPFQEEKPTCANCPIHCYQPHLREKIRQVMRYAGPRMFWRHPILTMRHWIDSYREAPDPRERAGSGRS